jgi:hypothetical protein
MQRRSQLCGLGGNFSLEISSRDMAKNGRVMYGNNEVLCRCIVVEGWTAWCAREQTTKLATKLYNFFADNFLPLTPLNIFQLRLRW